MHDFDFKRLICLSTIQDRKYTENLEGRFRPTELGVVVIDLLVEKRTKKEEVIMCLNK